MAKRLIEFRISIHALLAESDGFGLARMAPHAYFYPRSPCGERRKITITVDEGTLISIHALLAESDNVRPETRQPCAISIHALLAESDRNDYAEYYIHAPISIHALLAESDYR